MHWYTFDPCDTLFFRGADPMEMGESHVMRGLFPPHAQSLAGAIRTSLMRRHGVTVDAFKQGDYDPKLKAVLGKPGQTEPFTLMGPVFERDGQVFVPAPATWLHQKDKNDKKSETIDDKPLKKTIRIHRARPVTSPLFKASGTVLLAEPPGKELKNLTGFWVRAADLDAGSGDEIDVFPAGYFYDDEPRIGIALSRGRTARKSHLYSTKHVRLRPGVSLVFGCDRPLDFGEHGILHLGGERRFGTLTPRADPIGVKSDPSWFLALNYQGVAQTRDRLVASAGIHHIGGYDLHKGFHKDLCPYFGPGSVFKENLDNTIGMRGTA